MVNYRIEHERLHHAPTGFRVLRLMKGRRLLAEAKYLGDTIAYIWGKPDKEFTKRHHTSPAIELLMHVAHHNRSQDGTALLRFISLFPSAQTMIKRAVKKGEMKEENDEHSSGIRIIKIETKIPQVPVS
ncbi:MAG: hypothetical protein Q8R15_04740 [Candidatus Micrarchaeota archaeon]|nr:hypothetical protein [Candidatus Micrarchaeota archaeon]